MKEKLGTPLYSAPGVVMGGYNEKVDVWGIGIITHILLCGKPPFDGSTNQQIKQAILNDRPTFGGIKSSLSPEAI